MLLSVKILNSSTPMARRTACFWEGAQLLVVHPSARGLCEGSPSPALAQARSTHRQVPPRRHVGLPLTAKGLRYLLQGASERGCGETLSLGICCAPGWGELLPLLEGKLRKPQPREGKRILEGTGGLRSSNLQHREAQGGRASILWPRSHVQPTRPLLPPVNY